MAAVHFTTIPCEANRVNNHKESHVCEIRRCTDNIVCARVEVFKTFLCVFMSFFRGLSHAKNYVPVAIFFGKVDVSNVY